MLLGILAATAASAMMIATVLWRRERNVVTAKLTGWKRHRTENATRIILFNGNTFLFRNAVFGCLNEILRRANDANNRKDAKGNCKITLTASSITAANPLEGQRRIQARVHRSGNVIFTATAATCAFVYALYNAGAEQNG